MLLSLGSVLVELSISGPVVFVFPKLNRKCMLLQIKALLHSVVKNFGETFQARIEVREWREQV